MKSKASIKSHPIHPILVGFPIAFFTGTLAAHVAGWYLNKPVCLEIARHLNLAGVIMAVITAIPGLIDYIYTVPPKSSGKKRAAQHGMMNTTVLILFLIAWLLRKEETANPVILLALELAGVALMMVAGWMGGTLVHRNQIGVDQRYANAGKWNEQYFDRVSGQIEVARSEELKINAMKLLHIRNKRIVLARTEEGFYAFEDRCPHKGGSLAGGSLACGTVQCPWHGSQFLIKEGTVTAGPAQEAIETYAVEERNGKVYLKL
ncbi:MAG TPA: DUF2231 domain-containing protein [Flavisolibacter sp.]|jgi:nitrite reductase/ring-hydroxylating ferredoxin subunit/uncharacterized membrane protein|nr:DUF2231 domain-containing protein [Flavisolibacter sp.]